MVTADDVREIALALPRAYEALVRDRVKFRVGRIVFLSLSPDETELGFGYPREEREALIASEPDKFHLPVESDLRYNWVRVWLSAIDRDELRDLIVSSWRMTVPKKVWKEYLAGQQPPDGSSGMAGSVPGPVSVQDAGAPTPGVLGEYARISIAFTVDRILEVTLAGGGLGGMVLTEAPVADPYVKDYDAVKGEGPTRWPKSFDVSNWGLIWARRDGARVGGAVIAFRTPGVHMLGGRDDVAVLWDIRVAPGQRGAGVGSALFRAAEAWAGARGGRWLKIETQNVNAAACRFYQKMGCTLGAIDRFAYPELPGEVQLLWWKALTAVGEG